MLGPRLDGERVRLVPPEAAHCPAFIRWFADPNITRYLLYRFPVRKDITALAGYSAFFPGRFAESVGRTKTQSFGYAQVLFKF